MCLSCFLFFFFFLFVSGLFFVIFFCWGRRLIVADFKVKGYIFKEKDICLPYLHAEILPLEAYRCLTPFSIYFHMYSMSDQRGRLSAVLRLCIIQEICRKFWKMPHCCPSSLLSATTFYMQLLKKKTKPNKNTQTTTASKQQ